MRRLKVTGCAVLVAMAGAACARDVQSGAPDTSGTAQVLLAQPRAEDVATILDTTLIDGQAPSLETDVLGVNVGSADAPVKVIEFVDFGCGFCRQFQLETFPTIKTEFIDTNMIEWKFMPFVSGMFPNSGAATIAAECVLAERPNVFGTFANALWVRQREWKGDDDAAGLVREWAAELGVDRDGYDACLQDDLRHQRVASATALAGQLGVRSTPTFWIVGAGPVQGALPIDAFRQLFTEVHRQLTAPAA